MFGYMFLSHPTPAVPLQGFIPAPDSVFVPDLGGYVKHLGDFDTLNCPPVYLESIGMICNKSDHYTLRGDTVWAVLRIY
jgi:hypothetical protein